MSRPGLMVRALARLLTPVVAEIDRLDRQPAGAMRATFYGGHQFGDATVTAGQPCPEKHVLTADELPRQDHGDEWARVWLFR